MKVKSRAQPEMLARVNVFYGRGLAIATVALVVALGGYFVVSHGRAASSLAVSVSGNHLVNSQGQTVRLIGVNQFGHCSTGVVLHNPMTQAAVNNLKKYNINFVRIIMNEDCWLGINGLPGGGLTAASLHTQIVNYINLLNQNGIYVIFDLHTNAPDGNCTQTGGVCVSDGQQVMADEDHGPAYWTSVANTFKNNPAVILEAYNEPHITTADTNNAPDPWACWRDGCQVNEYNYSYNGPKVPMNWQGMGMQQIVNTIRTAGAHNVISLGGLGWSNNLSHFLDSDANGKPYLPTDSLHQLAASFHNYKGWGCSDTTCWNNQIAPVAAQMPVLTTEMGQSDCGYDFMGPWLDWADQHGISYTAWTWTVGTCDPAVSSGPSGAWGLLDADGVTPNSYGAPILEHFRQVDGCPLIKANLVNTCHPLTGAAALGNPGAADGWQPQFDYLEQLLGNQLDTFMDYHSPIGSGSNLATSPFDQSTTEGKVEASYANSGKLIRIDWVPSTAWLDSMPVAQGGNQAVNNQIAQAAQNIKAIAPHKVILSPWHEADLLVSDPGSTGSTTCQVSPAHDGGSPEQFVAAWKNIHDIFQAAGVTNVVWTIGYASYAARACWVPYMWPGNSYVDWISYDTYSHGNNWDDTAGVFYNNILVANNTSTRNYLSKPWAIGEFGDCDSNDDTQIGQYFGTPTNPPAHSVLAAFLANRYPNLKMYIIYADTGNASGPGCLTNYDANGTLDNTKEADINALFAAFIGGSPVAPTPTPTPPPSPSSPPPSPSSPPPTPTPIPGDINHDGNVNVCDMSILLSAWGTTDPAANLDGKGVVDIIDLSILISHWTGGTCGTPVP